MNYNKLYITKSKTMEKQDIKAIVFYENSTAITNDIAVLRDNASTLNNIIHEFNKLEIGKIESLNQLQELISNPKSFCDELIVKSINGPFEFAGMKVSKKRLIEMITPDEVNGFVSFVNNQRKKVPFKAKEWYPAIEGINNYEAINLPFIDEEIISFSNGKVTLIKESEDRIIEKYSCKIDTDEKRNLYDSIMNSVNSLNALNETLREKNISEIRVPAPNLIFTHEKLGKIIPDKKRLTFMMKTTK